VERGADALATFGDCFVGEANDGHALLKARRRVGHVHLHVDLARFDADECDGRDVRDGHAPMLSSCVLRMNGVEWGESVT
jgi:hypothetical protein